MKKNKILFRASGIGALMTEGRGLVLTENQKSTLQDYKLRSLPDGKPLTDKQKIDFELLLSKENAKPELSDTAKRFIEQMWLLNEKGFYQDLSNKYVAKGNFNEDDGIVLVSEIENSMYHKNTERKTFENITGECDIFDIIDGKRIIKDIKSSWSPLTFMSSGLSSLYEWQGRTYMMLYDAEEFHLHYTLTDTPRHLVEKEKEREFYKYFDKSMTESELESLELMLLPIYEQIESNMSFSNGNYSKEERVKTFKITRCKEKEKQLLEKIPIAIEYYEKIKLNQI
jgi:hypothetical protein